MTAINSRGPVLKSPLLISLSNELSLRHYSERTRQVYIRWVLRYIRFHAKRHPEQLGAEHVTEFLSSLAVKSGVSSSTQNQALAAISFLYKVVLNMPLEEIEPMVRAKPSIRLPVVLTRQEAARVIEGLEGTPRLIAALLYGSGLRVLECLQLRVKDVDFASREILVRAGKGDKDRVTVLPAAVVDPLREHLKAIQALHARDLRRGGGGWRFPMHWPASIPERRPSGGGSTSFRRRGRTSIR